MYSNKYTVQHKRRGWWLFGMVMSLEMLWIVANYLRLNVS
ncbi:KGW motif small protein [Acinetobacter soli]|nr:KGW motif small protein [Acinetobacter soli]MEB4800465.1 KGW motif small protein [Acinetobacter soli]